MTNYKETIYDNYITRHNKNLYGDIGLQEIRKWFPSWQYLYKRLLPANKQAHILDIGCGEGGFVYWLYLLGYENGCGIDISPEQIRSGTEIGIRNIFCEDLRDFLAGQTGKYELIIARDVLEHFTKAEVFEILALVRNSLVPGGKFIVQVPNGQGYFYANIFHSDFTHEVAFTSDSIHQIALNAGFASTKCYPINPVPAGVISGIRHVLWRYKELQLRFWKMVETGNSRGIFTQNLIAEMTK